MDPGKQRVWRQFSGTGRNVMSIHGDLHFPEGRIPAKSCKSAIAMMENHYFPRHQEFFSFMTMLAVV